MCAVGPEPALFLPCGLRGACHRSGTSPEAIRQSLTASRLIRKAIRETPESWQLPSSLTVSIPPIIIAVVVQQPTLEYEIWRAVGHLAINRGERNLQLHEEKQNLATCILLATTSINRWIRLATNKL